MHYFSLFFYNMLRIMRLFLAGFGEKHKVLRNFERKLKNFAKNSIETLKFFTIFGNVVAKIEPSEITSLFYNFFHLW